MMTLEDVGINLRCQHPHSPTHQSWPPFFLLPRLLIIYHAYECMFLPTDSITICSFFEQKGDVNYASLVKLNMGNCIFPKWILEPCKVTELGLSWEITGHC